MDGKGFEADEEAGADRKLWELLGKPAPVKVSPYFSRRVLVQVEADARRRSWAWPRWLRLPRAAGWGGAFAAIALGLSLMRSPGASPMRHISVKAAMPAAAVAPTEVQDVSPQDIQVIADLDNQLAREETAVWTDDSTVF